MIKEIKIDKEPFEVKRKLADYSENSVINKHTTNTIRYFNETKLKKKEKLLNNINQNIDNLKNITIKSVNIGIKSVGTELDNETEENINQDDDQSPKMLNSQHLSLKHSSKANSNKFTMKSIDLKQTFKSTFNS